MFYHGVIAELSQTKWEAELRQKQNAEYVRALKSIRWCLEHKDFYGIEHILKTVSV